MADENRCSGGRVITARAQGSIDALTDAGMAPKPKRIAAALKRSEKRTKSQG